jgi:hypothetical protein
MQPGLEYRAQAAFDLFKLLANMGSVLIVLAGVRIPQANRKLPLKSVRRYGGKGWVF